MIFLPIFGIFWSFLIKTQLFRAQFARFRPFVSAFGLFSAKMRENLPVLAHYAPDLWFSGPFQSFRGDFLVSFYLQTSKFALFAPNLPFSSFFTDFGVFLVVFDVPLAQVWSFNAKNQCFYPKSAYFGPFWPFFLCFSQRDGGFRTFPLCFDPIQSKNRRFLCFSAYFGSFWLFYVSNRPFRVNFCSRCLLAGYFSRFLL
ncbi:hypothetical protein HYV43_05315 [Candidatus Micrarchaeota archaeon]|nr:hypothetical protein [Candidatus Micrarchaeota archaeon]